MRITAGTAKNVQIKSPRGVPLRPMMEKVREALFNMLTAMGALRGRFLDLYAGTGSVGIEALSRGVAWADFVERDYRTARTIRENLAAARLAERGRVHVRRVEDVLERPELLDAEPAPQPYALISVTPPYEEVDFLHILTALVDTPFVAPGTIVIVEYPNELEALPETIGPLEKIRDRRYGRTRLALFEWPRGNDTRDSG